MKYFKKYKLFWKSEKENKKVVKLLGWNEAKQDYYTFVKECVDRGYHQISITGEIMLAIIEKLATNININISKIELMEKDYEEGNQLKSMVDMFRTNRAVLVDIVKTLRYLEDESSIEIKKVTFDDVKNKNILFIQVNGLIGTSNIQSNIEQDIINLIKEYINR